MSLKSFGKAAGTTALEGLVAVGYGIFKVAEGAYNLFSSDAVQNTAAKISNSVYDSADQAYQKKDIKAAQYAKMSDDQLLTEAKRIKSLPEDQRKAPEVLAIAEELRSRGIIDY